MLIRVIPVGSLRTNCYIVICGQTKEAIVIDPGDESAKIIKEISKNGCKIKQIIITHNHPDHTGAVLELKNHLKADIRMGGEEFNYNNIPVDLKLENGATYGFGALKYKIFHAPGHTPGSVCLIFEKEKKIFSGDVLFCAGAGRTDLPGGSAKKMENSLAELLTYDDDYEVYPGHGPATTIGKEK